LITLESFLTKKESSFHLTSYSSHQKFHPGLIF
jgi:hypothetical protein